MLWPWLEWVVGFDLPCVKSSRGWSSYELFRGRVMVLDSMKVLVGDSHCENPVYQLLFVLLECMR